MSEQISAKIWCSFDPFDAHLEKRYVVARRRNTACQSFSGAVCAGAVLLMASSAPAQNLFDADAIRDEELAKLLRRSPVAVKGRRESLNIPIFAPQRMRWSRREIELLGKRPDPVVARMLGRTKYAVQLKRHSLGIARFVPTR